MISINSFSAYFEKIDFWRQKKKKITRNSMAHQSGHSRYAHLLSLLNICVGRL